MSEKKISELSLKERAAQIKIEKLILRIIPIIMSCLAILTVTVYIVSVFYSKFGGFSVTINKYHYVEYGLSLSETRDFASATSTLNCQASELITNIAGDTLDRYDLGAIDGDSSGDNYLCYTFYCKNSGTEAVSFEYSINIEKMTMDIEKAVRIRLITSIKEADQQDDIFTNQQTETFARVSSTQDEQGNYLPEEGTTEFKTSSVVVNKGVHGFMKNDVMKFTVVIWLEGNDPECVDDIIGGEFKIGMKFNILSGGAEESSSSDE